MRQAIKVAESEVRAQIERLEGRKLSNATYWDRRIAKIQEVLDAPRDEDGLIICYLDLGT